MKRTGLAVALLAGIVVGPDLARGQCSPGTTELYGTYDIQFNGQVVGHVVVVHGNPPTGYSAETEYWHWNTGQAWRGAFKLVPVSPVPSHGAYSWVTFPHDHFDLSGTVSFPSVDPGAGDAFYRVSTKVGSTWVDQGYLWVLSGSSQEAYGKNLSSNTFGGVGQEIRFESVEPPSPGSESVYLLQ